MNRQELQALADARNLVGLFPNISDEDYHAGPGASNTDLGYVDQSPRHYQSYKRNGWAGTKDTEEGKWFHKIVLEPERLEQVITICDAGINWGTKKYDELKSRLSPDRILIAKDVYERLLAMRDALMEVPGIERILAGHKELSAYAIDPETGILRKARPDIYHDELRINFDLKSTKDASPDEFAKSCFNYRYFVQGPYHMDTVNLAIRQQTKRKYGTDPGDVVDTPVLIAVERDEPFGVALYALGYDEIAFGRVKYGSNLATLAECLASGQEKWRCYPKEIQTLNLPGWAFYK